MTTTTDYTYYLFLGQNAPVDGVSQFVVLTHNYAGSANDLIFTGGTLAAGGSANWHTASSDITITYTGFTTPDGGPIIALAPAYPGAPPQYYALANTLSAPLTPVAAQSFACFLSGTQIATPDGERSVETLKAGDLVSLAGGGAADIAWIGWRTLQNPDHASRAVRIRAHSFGLNQPRRDLYLSPEHRIFRAGVLVPIKALINGGSIQDVDLGPIRYFHILLEEHDVILAEGLACETLLDVDDPVTFANAASAPANLAFLRPAAPIQSQGPVVEMIRAQLAAQERKVKQDVLF